MQLEAAGFVVGEARESGHTVRDGDLARALERPRAAVEEAVTTVVLSVFSRLPNASSSRTKGWVANGCPAVAVDDCACWTTNWLAAAGETTIGPEAANSRTPLVNSSVMVWALSSARLAKVATPPRP